MGNNENNFVDRKTLYDSLVKIRRAGNRNNGSDRVKELRPIIDAIKGTKTEYSNTQYAICFQALLKHYIYYDELDLLLAVCGYGEPFSHIKYINGRREAYQKMHNVDILARSLGKREDMALVGMAEAMLRDYSNEPKKLLHIIDEALGKNDSDIHIKEVNAIITNIDLTKVETFIDRKYIIEELKTNFDKDISIQALIGAYGEGKTFLSLQYARSFSNRYSIMCYIDSNNEYCQRYCMADFLKTANIGFDSNDLPNTEKIFKSFFKSKKDYLIIFDNVHDINGFIQQLDFANGHILVVSDDIWVKGSNVYHKLDGIEFDNDIQDRYKYLKTALDQKELTNDDRILISQFSRASISYILSINYIKNSRWMDSTLYLQMLQDYGIYPESSGQNTDLLDDVVFDIVLRSLYIKWGYQFDKMANAVREFLLLNAFFSNCCLDLNLLSTELSVFPYTLNEVCKHPYSLAEFSNTLKELGFLEIRENQFLHNRKMAILYAKHFHETVYMSNADTIKDRTIIGMMSKIEELIPTIDDAMLIEYLSQLAYAFEEKRFELPLGYEKIESSFPNLHRISHYPLNSEEYMPIDELVKKQIEKDRR